MTIDVPEEPDVEPTEAAEAEAEQQMTAISFFTAARYSVVGFLGHTFQMVDCRIARWMAKAYGYASKERQKLNI